MVPLVLGLVSLLWLLLVLISLVSLVLLRSLVLVLLAPIADQGEVIYNEICKILFNPIFFVLARIEICLNCKTFAFPGILSHGLSTFAEYDQVYPNGIAVEFSDCQAIFGNRFAVLGMSFPNLCRVFLRSCMSSCLIFPFLTVLVDYLPSNFKLQGCAYTLTLVHCVWLSFRAGNAFHCSIHKFIYRLTSHVFFYRLFLLRGPPARFRYPSFFKQLDRHLPR